VTGEEPHVVPRSGGTWASPAEAGAGDPAAREVAGSWDEMAAAYHDGAEEDLALAMGAVSSALSRLEAGQEGLAGRIEAEILYHRIRPFTVAWFLYLPAFLLFVLPVLLRSGRGPRWAMVPLLAGFVVHTAGLGLRWYVAGRAPWSNMYESLTMTAWGIVAFALMLGLSRRNRILYGVAAGVGTIALALADYLPVDQSISPLVAVLRSYWLTIHVSCILLSYSAFALAAGVAHFQLWGRFFRPDRPEIERQANAVLYTTVKVGTFLISVGIILGAWWASESWGRYWAWDPKETWSLITLLGYLALLHGRIQGWVGSFGMAVGSILAFFLVIMTYYGVNYFLVGLHSYAGGDAGRSIPPALAVYLAAELAVTGFAWYRERSGRRLDATGGA
jgi:cytochrome c-type biogenesis protein CcsB